MKRSKVYFVSSRILNKKGLLQKFSDLLKYLQLDFIKQDDNVLVKTHFGEEGNHTYISPIFLRKLTYYIKSKQAHPFLGDTNTLYKGDRKQGVTHLELALRHGFSYATLNAPLVILDGIGSRHFKEIKINGKHFEKVQLAGNYFSADAAVVVSHVKGHVLTAMGAAIKNISMGLGTRTQKQRMHGDIKPQINHKKCILCQNCVRVCPENAISIKNKKIEINLEKCVGCAECITMCPTGALKILWNEKPQNTAEKMAETALAAVKQKAGKIFFFNFLINITPDCDCLGWSDNALVNDIGILASHDPLAIDKASVDLVNKQHALPNSRAENTKGDILGKQDLDLEDMFEYCQKIGLGNKEYELIDLGW